MEKVIGGYPASQQDFKYQAALVGKYNFSNVPHLICSAGILNSFLLISTARCFLQRRFELKRYTFYAVVKTDIIKSNALILNEIDKIYTCNYNHFGFKNDLSISRLKESLNHTDRTRLSFLKLPNRNEKIHGKIGIIAGFGIDSLEYIQHRKRCREAIRINSVYGVVLKQANVTIINLAEIPPVIDGIVCGEDAKYFTDICGLILANQAHQIRGVCVGDNGSPLVIDNKVVGVVSSHNANCDDTLQGAIYTKVSSMVDAINGIINGSLLHGTKTYINPTHISHPKYLPKET